jgi:hypothetical protein
MTLAVVDLGSVRQQRDAPSDFINQQDRFWFAMFGHMAPIAVIHWSLLGATIPAVADSRPKPAGIRTLR